MREIKTLHTYDVKKSYENVLKKSLLKETDNDLMINYSAITSDQSG